YAATAGSWGLSDLEDQQLAGIIMWIPGSIPYVIAGLVLFARWLKESETRTVRHYATVMTVRGVVLFIAVVALTSCDRASGDDRFQIANADPGRGRDAIRPDGCGSCSTLPAVCADA